MSKTPIQTQPATDASPVTVLAPPKPGAASAPKLRQRHWGMLVSFFLLVLLPTAAAVFYLFAVAADQYSSRVSFSIRSEEFQNPLEALGSLGQISTGTSSDAGILNEYIRSQKLLEDIKTKVDLGALYSKPSFDPIFAFDADKPIEDLLTYWTRMTYVVYDPGSGLIDIEAFAFTPQDATLIATAIMQASSELVDELSNIAREDTTRHAAFELEKARERLTEARLALGELRGREQLVDPRADLDSRMGVMTALQQQLAQTVIEYDLLVGSTRDGDPRLGTVQRKIEAIENRIRQERNKIGQVTTDGGDAFATVVGNYETLLADREFAEQSYIAAAATYDNALAEARRKSRYLAAHVPPTTAESSQYPNRVLIAGGVFGALVLFWMISVLTVYAMLDRR
jgi:capsular polysaccharide transport system permease protein